MHIVFSKRFKKRHGRLGLELQNKFRNRLMLLLEDKGHPLLNIHLLNGQYLGCQSLNVTGDVRAIFEIQKDEEVILFMNIGTHSELY